MQTDSLRLIRAEETWAIAGAYYVRVQAMAKKHSIPLWEEFDEHDVPETRYVLALDGDFPVGTARMYDLGGGRWMIGRVVVLPEYRHQGLGSRIVRECEAWMRDLGASCAVLESRDNKQEFYLSLGYQISGEGEMVEGVTFRTVRMEKPL